MEQVSFGRTGLEVSRLCAGTGTNGWAGRSDQTALGVDGLARLLRRAYEAGVTFWDAADEYGSHPHIARALNDLPRDEVVVATKTMARTRPDAERAIARFRRELGTDVLDIVLLHCMSSKGWPSSQEGAMEALTRAKERGEVRAVGISSHGLGALDAAADCDWVDVALVRLNHAGVNMDGSVDHALAAVRRLAEAGKAIYAMKVLGCGSLGSDARKAFEFICGIEGVHAFTVGMTSEDELDENVRLVEELDQRMRQSA